MYEEFYHLNEKPFSLSPDPSFLFLGKSHRRALNILEYGVESDSGITVVSGEVGTGKTTLIRSLMNELGEEYTIGLITNTQRDFGSLLKWVLLSFGVDTDETDPIRLYKQLVTFINQEHEAGRRVILIIDEAQNLGPDALEDIRMLTNINVDKDVVLHIDLFLDRPAFVRGHVASIESCRDQLVIVAETAGGDENLFAQTAFAAVYYHSGGIPRLINTICDMALVYGYADEAPRIRKEIILDAIRDRKVGGLVIRDDQNFNQAAEDLRQQIIDKTGVDIAEVG